MKGNAMQTIPPVRKAVIPVAGLGTRFLPFTKACPKEMLPIVDKPLVQYAVEEAHAAGITHIVFVTSRSKRAIEDHFDTNSEVQMSLASQGRTDLARELAGALPANMHYAYVRQAEPLGLGHAVLCARPLVGDEPFAVILPDDLMQADTPVLAQMVAAWERTGASMVAVQDVPRNETDRYGIVEVEDSAADLSRMHGIVEKPRPSIAPSTLAVVGRYILSPAIFGHLATLTPGAKGELQLTDGIARLLADAPVHAFRFRGVRHDCGSKLGFLTATVQFALAHRELAAPFRRFLGQLRTPDDGAEESIPRALLARPLAVYGEQDAGRLAIAKPEFSTLERSI